jgi:hypothetical protein
MAGTRDAGIRATTDTAGGHPADGGVEVALLARADIVRK